MHRYNFSLESGLRNNAMQSRLAMGSMRGKRTDLLLTQEVGEKITGGSAEWGDARIDWIAPKFLSPVVSVINRCRNYHTLKTCEFQKPFRILPSVSFEAVAKVMGQGESDYHRAADDFCTQATRDAVMRDAESRHPKWFDADIYPADFRDLRERFHFEWEVQPMPDTSALQRLAVPGAKEIAAQAESYMRDRLGHSQADGMRKLVKAISELAETMQAYRPAVTDSDGRVIHESAGVFRNSYMEKIRDLMSVAHGFNLLSDPEIEKILNRAQAELCKYDSDSLRDNSAARNSTAKAAADIAKSLEAFI